MRASLSWAAAGTAVALAAALSLAGTASAAVRQPARTPTTLSIVEAKTTIIAGEKDVISGVLLTGTKPVADQVIYLYRYTASAKKWLPVEVDLTSHAGKAAFTVTPKTTSYYELIFRGTSKLAPSHSGVATVVVVTREPTTLSVAETEAVIAPGQQDVISGVLLTGTTPVANEAVQLYRYSSTEHKWLLRDTDLTSYAGQVQFTVTPESTAYYELVFRGTSGLAASHSGVATVVVTKEPTTLSIEEAATTIHAGQQDIISGVLLTGPTPLVREVVYLYYYKASAKKWLPVDVDLTSGAGKAAFVVHPQTTTDYELVFKGTASLYSADSGVATVTVTS